MEPIKPSDDGIEHLNAQWLAIQSRLREQEQVLAKAIERYVHQQGPRPEQLMKEVEALRADCAERFRVLMEAVRRQGGEARRQQQQQPQQQGRSQHPPAQERPQAKTQRRRPRRAGPASDLHPSAE